VTPEELRKARNRRYNKSEKGRARTKRYCKTFKSGLRYHKYELSDKGKARIAKYRHTERGMAVKLQADNKYSISQHGREQTNWSKRSRRKHKLIQEQKL